MDRQELEIKKQAVLQRVGEHSICREFLVWVSAQGDLETLLDMPDFKLCLACLLEDKWSLEKAKRFLIGGVN